MENEEFVDGESIRQLIRRADIKKLYEKSSLSGLIRRVIEVEIASYPLKSKKRKEKTLSPNEEDAYNSIKFVLDKFYAEIDRREILYRGEK